MYRPPVWHVRASARARTCHIVHHRSYLLGEHAAREHAQQDGDPDRERDHRARARCRPKARRRVTPKEPPQDEHQPIARQEGPVQKKQEKKFVVREAHAVVDLRRGINQSSINHICTHTEVRTRTHGQW
jgi:hypothetical protein